MSKKKTLKPESKKFGHPYYNKFWKRLILFCKELECYTIEVRALSDLADILDLEFNQAFINTLDTFRHKFRQLYWEFDLETNKIYMEVIPF